MKDKRIRPAATVKTARVGRSPAAAAEPPSSVTPDFALAPHQAAAPNLHRPTPRFVQTLQRISGNRAVNRLLSQVTGAGIVQRAFTINGVALVGAALTNWLRDYIHPDQHAVRAQVRAWSADPNYTTNHASDLAALQAAKDASDDTVLRSNSAIGHQISLNTPPNAVPYATHSVWSAWYFSGLEYQNNKTNGWHSNRAGLLPGGPTQDGAPTRYVEFRRPGAKGTSEVDKMERCVFDLLTGRCYPNAHYDGGYVEISNVPGAVQNYLRTMAIQTNGIQERINVMTPGEIAVAGPTQIDQIRWVLTQLPAVG